MIPNGIPSNLEEFLSSTNSLGHIFCEWLPLRHIQLLYILGTQRNHGVCLFVALGLCIFYIKTESNSAHNNNNVP